MFPRFLCALLLALLAAAAGPAAAQSDADQTTLQLWNRELDEAVTAVARPSLGSGEMELRYRRALAIEAAAQSLRDSLQPKIDAVSAEVSALARPPGDTSPEPPVVTAARTQQQALLARLDALAKQAEIVGLRASELLTEIDDLRTQWLERALFARNRTILNPELWIDAWREAGSRWAVAASTLGDWFDVLRRGGRTTLAALLGIAALGGGLALSARAIIRRSRADPADAGSGGRRIEAAAWIVIAAIAVTMIPLFAARAILFRTGLLPAGAVPILSDLTTSALAFATAASLASALFSPAHGAWRLIRLPDPAARKVWRLIVIAALAGSAIGLVERPAPETASTSAVSAFPALLAVVLALATFHASRLVARSATATTDPPQPHPRWSWILPLAMLAAAIVIAAAVLGYLEFAAFLAVQMEWSFAVIGVAILAIGIADRAIAEFFSPDTLTGRAITGSLMLSGRIVDQIGVVLGGIARVFVLVLAGLAIVAPWGVDSGDLAGRLSVVMSGIRVGSLTISLKSIVAGTGLFALVFILFHVFRTWLGEKLLPKTSLDFGLKNSILTIVSYVGVVAAAVVAMTYAGFDLANIAIVAGALSVGIGFGLQSIVNNFVSGLILLAERPIRAGDWIEVGPDKGTVRRISVRATEIETPDRASVVIPNSSLISGTVTNASLRDRTGRLQIAIGVGYDSDPDKVRDILTACAVDHPLVLKEPPPSVNFADFGDSSLDFVLSCHVGDIARRAGVMSDLRFAILRKLREAGVEIPFPQQDLNLRDWPKIEQAVLQLLRSLPASGNPAPTNQASS